ncbi:MAG: HepT-like ribonuclease domain-containing protein [Candidatus Sumerlaeaceae bacterium]
MEADQLGRLRDILNAAQLITAYVSGIEFAGFAADQEKQDAVIRRIEIIGEAAGHLRLETRDAIPALNFRRMRAMRNIVAHDYANVDAQIVWEVATIHIRDLWDVLEKFFSETADSSSSES